jgi:hypothetical protein
LHFTDFTFTGKGWLKQFLLQFLDLGFEDRDGLKLFLKRRDMLIFLLGFELAVLNLFGKLVDFSSHTFDDLSFVILANLINFVDFLCLSLADFSLGYLSFFISTGESEELLSDSFELDRKLLVLSFKRRNGLVILRDGVVKTSNFLLLVLKFLWNFGDWLVFLGNLRSFGVNDLGKLLNLLWLLDEEVIDCFDLGLPVEQLCLVLILDRLKLILPLFSQGNYLLSQNCDLTRLFFKILFQYNLLSFNFLHLSQSLDHSIILVEDLRIVPFL